MTTDPGVFVSPALPGIALVTGSLGVVSLLGLGQIDLTLVLRQRCARWNTPAQWPQDHALALSVGPAGAAMDCTRPGPLVRSARLMKAL